MPNVLKPEKRVAIVAALTEGCSIRSTARMVGVSRNTVTKLLAFSKNVENHVAAVALHFMAYNFCRVHGTVRTTPAVAAGIARRPWSVAIVVGAG